jgi:hypothetical protein
MPPHGNGVATDGRFDAQNHLCLHLRGQQAHNDTSIIDVNNHAINT